MAQLEVVTEREIAAEPNDVFDAIADYAQVRPKLLPEQYTDFEVRKGGDGEGTVFACRFHATSRRVRDLLCDVAEPSENVLVESDRNSTLVTRYTVVPADSGDGARVTIRSTWQGAGGIGGFFERRFAPRGLDAVYQRLLAALAAEMERDGRPEQQDRGRTGGQG